MITKKMNIEITVSANDNDTIDGEFKQAIDKIKKLIYDEYNHVMDSYDVGLPDSTGNRGRTEFKFFTKTIHENEKKQTFTRDEVENLLVGLFLFSGSAEEKDKMKEIKGRTYGEMANHVMGTFENTSAVTEFCNNLKG